MTQNNNSISKILTEINTHIENLKLNSNTPTVSNAKIISILYGCPCLGRCAHDIEKANTNGNGKKYEGQRVDSLYIARHDLAKNTILEAINSKFRSKPSEIKSEYDYGRGKLDISIENNLVIINNQNTRIGIEIKSGTYVDLKSLYQIVRYLFNVNILIFVRVPTQQVDVIHQKDVIDQLTSGTSTIINKIDRIISKDITKTQGDCCNGCTANCEFVKPPKFAESPKANLADFAEFLKNVEAVKEKVIRVLETCIYENEIPEIDSKRP